MARYFETKEKAIDRYIKDWLPGYGPDTGRDYLEESCDLDVGYYSGVLEGEVHFRGILPYFAEQGAAAMLNRSTSELRDKEGSLQENFGYLYKENGCSHLHIHDPYFDDDWPIDEPGVPPTYGVKDWLDDLVISTGRYVKGGDILYTDLKGEKQRFIFYKGEWRRARVDAG